VSATPAIALFLPGEFPDDTASRGGIAGSQDPRQAKPSFVATVLVPRGNNDETSQPGRSDNPRSPSAP
jgi:hypothetical protein